LLDIDDLPDRRPLCGVLGPSSRKDPGVRGFLPVDCVRPARSAAAGATVAVADVGSATRWQTLRRAMRTLDPQSLTKHVDRLYRAAWALCGSREDAEDLVQETFARVLSRPRVLRGDDELYYLMRVLRNTFLTSLRTASRRPLTAAAIEDVVAADPRPTNRPEQAYEVQEVYATIAQLPDSFRLALVAVDVLGLSYKEAARALHVREATITTRLFRARKQVAERLASEIRREENDASGVLFTEGAP
jgi:RNA polymerase sigma-70 factor, ECF subfamily